VYPKKTTASARYGCFVRRWGKVVSTCQSFLTSKITEPNLMKLVWLRYQRFIIQIPDLKAMKQAETLKAGRI
jgi:hypothetical protein